MSVKERLIEYLKFKKIGYSLFGRTIDVSSAFVTSMRNSIQPDKVERIALNYPDLNIGWLLTGEGNMLRTDALGLLPESLGGDEPIELEPSTNQTDKFLALLKAKDEQIDRLLGLLDKALSK